MIYSSVTIKEIIRFKARWFIIFSSLLFGFIQNPLYAVVLESHKYLETTGDLKQFFYWILEETNPYKLTYKSDEETFITLCDKTMNTKSWHAVNRSTQTDVMVEKRDGFLHMEGVHKGKKLKRKKKIGDDLWLQSSSLSLRPFIASDEKSLDYWTIRPDNFKVYKLRAKKMLVETIDSAGEKVIAQKIKLSLTGILQGVWKSHYWFRISDGLFLRFEGRSGLPGNPLAILDYVEALPVNPGN